VPRRRASCMGRGSRSEGRMPHVKVGAFGVWWGAIRGLVSWVGFFVGSHLHGTRLWHNKTSMDMSTTTQIYKTGAEMRKSLGLETA